MKKLDFYEKVEVYNGAGRSKGCFAGWRTKDYIQNGFRVLFVLVVLFLVFAMKQPKKEQNGTPPPSNNHSISDPHKVDLILLKNATGLGA
ncbi:hypothetical protein MKX03_009501, partial [Papaver bracteatum]